MRKECFEEGHYYHIYSRGVDKRTIFGGDRDKIRFIHTLYILNNFIEIPNRFDILSLEPRELLSAKQPYVEIVAGCLMENHYHFMLTPKVKGGVSKFLHKVGTSYTMYFNKLHERTGRLFESTFKAKPIETHEYAAYLTHYIHLNPLDLFQAKPGTKGLLEKIESYPWSSLPDYLGKSSHLSILLSLSFRDNVLDLDANQYKNFLKEFYENLS